MSSHPILGLDPWSLVAQRRVAPWPFLTCAASLEMDPSTSRRFDKRGDVRRADSVLELSTEPWWDLVVCTCFDSVVGSTAAASEFREPLRPELVLHSWVKTRRGDRPRGVAVTLALQGNWPIPDLHKVASRR